MTTPPRTFTLKDETTISGQRDRGRFLRGLSEEDWPAVVAGAVEGLAENEKVMSAPYDAAEHETARDGWWWAKRM